MVAEEIRRAAQAAPLARLCEVTAALWKAFGAGGVSEAEAEEISGLIEARRAVGANLPDGKDATSFSPGTRSGKFAPRSRRPQRPPVRSVAVERRRRLAASGPMPPALAARFTTGELAVLRIVVDEHRDRGSCRLCLDAIAARAGVSRSLAKAAIKQARWLGMVEVVERRRVGAKSLPNVVTVVDREWLAWITRGARSKSGSSEWLRSEPSSGIGGRNFSTTENRDFREGFEAAATMKGCRGAEIDLNRSGRRRIRAGGEAR